MHRTLFTRTCKQCGSTYQTYGPRSLYCAVCAAERKRTAYHRKSNNLPGSEPTRQVGSTDLCQLCGKPYTVRSGPQRFCPDCAAKRYKPKSKAPAKTAICAVCGAEFVVDGPRATTCSPECAEEYRRRRRAEYYQTHKTPCKVIGFADICARCGAPYTRTGTHQKYCPNCAVDLHKPHTRHLGDTAFCDACGRAYTIANPNQHFCQSCAGTAHKRRAPAEKSAAAVRGALSVPDNLPALLEQYHIPQRRFALYFGIAPSVISKWCSGARGCKPYIIAMAAKVLSLAADEIRGEEEGTDENKEGKQ